MTLASSACIMSGVVAHLERAGGRASGGAAPRSPDRCRRCRRWSASPRAGARAGCRAPARATVARYAASLPPSGLGMRARQCSRIGSMPARRTSRTRRRARRRSARAVGMPVQLGGHVVLEAAAGAVRVRDVARRLLEVRHQPAPLEHLGQQVGCALAGEVHAAELRHRVVAVLVRARARRAARLGACRPRRGAEAPGRCSVPGRNSSRNSRRSDFARARVAGEQRALHDLGQVDEREHGPVEVREVRRQRRALRRAERFHAHAVGW